MSETFDGRTSPGPESVPPDFTGVLELLERVPRDPQAAPIEGASHEAILDLEARLGEPLPVMLAGWLRACNGAVAGPGVLYGARPLEPTLDAYEAQHQWESWPARGWLPVASDGTGNSYVVALGYGESSPVFFIDCSEDPDSLAYVVGSDLVAFLAFLLGEELMRTGWPFSHDFVTTADPAITAVRGAPLPWST